MFDSASAGLPRQTLRLLVGFDGGFYSYRAPQPNQNLRGAEASPSKSDGAGRLTWAAVECTTGAAAGTGGWAGAKHERSIDHEDYARHPSLSAWPSQLWRELLHSDGASAGFSDGRYGIRSFDGGFSLLSRPSAEPEPARARLVPRPATCADRLIKAAAVECVAWAWAHERRHGRSALKVHMRRRAAVLPHPPAGRGRPSELGGLSLCAEHAPAQPPLRHRMFETPRKNKSPAARYSQQSATQREMDNETRQGSHRSGTAIAAWGGSIGDKALRLKASRWATKITINTSARRSQIQRGATSRPASGNMRSTLSWAAVECEVAG